MYSKDVNVENNTGMHARPASMFVTEAIKYKSNVTVTKNFKEANAKSIISILSLGVSKGDNITISAEGPDEGQAVSALFNLVKSRFGEK